MPSRSCRPRGQPVRVCAASSDAPAQGDARRAPLHAQALRRRESAAAIQARRYAPEKKQACEVRAYGNAAVAAAAATEATCALDIVVTRRCRAHLCVPRGNPEARGGLCQCHRGKPGWGSWGSPGPSFTQSTPLTSPTCISDAGTISCEITHVATGQRVRCRKVLLDQSRLIASVCVCLRLSTFDCIWLPPSSGAARPLGLLLAPRGRFAL